MKTNLLHAVFVSAFFLYVSAFAFSQTTWYVDDDNTGGPWDGSQAHPFQIIQDGIDAAVDWDTVLVLPGTYVGNIDFLGKASTVKSIDGPDVTTIDGNWGAGSAVRFLMGEESGSVLDGFTITKGGHFGIALSGSSPTLINNAIQVNSTGGINCVNGSSPIIMNNTIQDNSGMGIDCRSSSPTITNNIISGHSAWVSGGIYCADYSSPIITNNTITGNPSTHGGIYCADYSSPFITNNTITGNSSSFGGGITCQFWSSSTITNNTITNNSSNSCGGGIACAVSSSSTITNNIISGNSANYGGGISYDQNSNSTVTNTILWDNSAAEGPEIWIGSESSPSILSISYSNIKGGQDSIYVDNACTLNWGPGMIDADPLFVTGPLGEFYLSQIAAGQGSDSPCIDSGDPISAMIHGNTRTDGVQDSCRVDMGYHYPLGNGVYIIDFDTYPGSFNEIASTTKVDNIWTPWGVNIDAHSFNAKAMFGAFAGKPSDHPDVEDCIPLSEPNFIKTCMVADDLTSDAGVFVFTFIHPETQEPLTASHVSVYFLDVEEQGGNPDNSRLEAYDVDDNMLAVVSVPEGLDGQQFLAEIEHPGIHYVKAFVGQPDPYGDSGALDNFCFTLEPVENKESSDSDNNCVVPARKKL